MADDVTVIDGVFGRRYGEVLLVTVTESGPEATVYNTFPLNDCPAELWDKLDAKAIAEENGAAAALLNGPRYWLMSSIGKAGRESLERKIFGGLEMLRQATVALASMNPAPYQLNRVNRKAVFIFDADREIYELVDPDGRRWSCRPGARRSTPPCLEMTCQGWGIGSPCLPAGVTSRTRRIHRCGGHDR